MSTTSGVGDIFEIQTSQNSGVTHGNGSNMERGAPGTWVLPREEVVEGIEDLISCGAFHNSKKGMIDISQVPDGERVYVERNPGGEPPNIEEDGSYHADYRAQNSEGMPILDADVEKTLEERPEDGNDSIRAVAAALGGLDDSYELLSQGDGPTRLWYEAAGENDDLDEYNTVEVVTSDLEPGDIYEEAQAETVGMEIKADGDTLYRMAVESEYEAEAGETLMELDFSDQDTVNWMNWPIKTADTAFNIQKAWWELMKTPYTG